jgi:nicotinamide-nucleotide amidase
VIPHLRSYLPGEPPHLATLKIFGLGESEVGDRLEGLGTDLPAVARLKIQYRATFPEIHVRLVLTGLDGAAAREALDRVAAEAAGRLGHHVFATGGARLDTSFAEVVVATLVRRAATFSVVEACTDGLVSELALAAPAGATVHRGAVVAADPLRALQALGRPPGVAPESCGALALELAGAARALFGTTLGLATAGSAEPSPLGRAGEVCLAIAGPDGTDLRELYYPIDRERFRTLAAHAALSRLRSWAR